MEKQVMYLDAVYEIKDIEPVYLKDDSNLTDKYICDPYCIFYSGNYITASFKKRVAFEYDNNFLFNEEVIPEPVHYVSPKILPLISEFFDKNEQKLNNLIKNKLSFVETLQLEDELNAIFARKWTVVYCTNTFDNEDFYLVFPDGVKSFNQFFKRHPVREKSEQKSSFTEVNNCEYRIKKIYTYEGRYLDI